MKHCQILVVFGAIFVFQCAGIGLFGQFLETSLGDIIDTQFYDFPSGILGEALRERLKDLFTQGKDAHVIFVSRSFVNANVDFTKRRGFSTLDQPPSGLRFVPARKVSSAVRSAASSRTLASAIRSLMRL